MNKFVDCLDRALEKIKRDRMVRKIIKKEIGMFPIIFQGPTRSLVMIWGQVSPQFHDFRIVDMSKTYEGEKPEPIFEGLFQWKQQGDIWMRKNLNILRQDSLEMEALGLKQVKFSKYILQLESCDIHIKRTCQDGCEGVFAEMHKDDECVETFPYLTDDIKSSLILLLSFRRELFNEYPEPIMKAIEASYESIRSNSK